MLILIKEDNYDIVFQMDYSDAYYTEMEETMVKTVFDEKRCKACGLCAAACPKKIIRINTSKIEINGLGCAEIAGEGCIGCGICATVCPDMVISIYRET